MANMAQRPVSESDFDRLETVDWGERNFGSLVTNRQFPRRAMLRLVEKGLVRSIGQVLLCDDDGWHLEPEREREGFGLTEVGRKLLVEHRNAQMSEWRARFGEGEPYCSFCGNYEDECECAEGDEGR